MWKLQNRKSRQTHKIGATKRKRPNAQSSL
jgi:hypothetical protein